jgi:hypothetical protein
MSCSAFRSILIMTCSADCATRLGRADSGGDIDGDWEAAIKAARDSVEMSNYSTSNLRGPHAREYNVAESAKALKRAGYAIRLEPGFIAVEEAAQTSLVAEIERLTSVDLTHLCIRLGMTAVAQSGHPVPAAVSRANENLVRRDRPASERR